MKRQTVTNPSSRRTGRSGATPLEMAFALSFMLMTTFGIFDWAWVFFARHTMFHAARESARAIAIQEMTTDQGRTLAQDILSASLSRHTFTIDVENTLDPIVRVSVSIPIRDLGLSGITTLTTATMTATATVPREGYVSRGNYDTESAGEGT